VDHTNRILSPPTSSGSGGSGGGGGGMGKAAMGPPTHAFALLAQSVSHRCNITITNHHTVHLPSSSTSSRTGHHSHNHFIDNEDRFKRLISFFESRLVMKRHHEPPHVKKAEWTRKNKYGVKVEYLKVVKTIHRSKIAPDEDVGALLESSSSSSSSSSFSSSSINESNSSDSTFHSSSSQQNSWNCVLSYLEESDLKHQLDNELSHSNSHPSSNEEERSLISSTMPSSSEKVVVVVDESGTCERLHPVLSCTQQDSGYSDNDSANDQMKQRHKVIPIAAFPVSHSLFNILQQDHHHNNHKSGSNPSPPSDHSSSSSSPPSSSSSHRYHHRMKQGGTSSASSSSLRSRTSSFVGNGNNIARDEEGGEMFYNYVKSFVDGNC